MWRSSRIYLYFVFYFSGICLRVTQSIRSLLYLEGGFTEQRLMENIKRTANFLLRQRSYGLSSTSVSG